MRILFRYGGICGARVVDILIADGGTAIVTSVGISKEYVTGQSLSAITFPCNSIFLSIWKL
jgi:hypothetical protein